MGHFDIVIAGAGYGGVMCALRLAGRTRSSPIRIAVVSPFPHFCERLRLHEGLATKPPPLRTLELGSFLGELGICFIEATVLRIEQEARSLLISSDDTDRRISFDRLVIATGSTSRTHSINGMDEFAYVMETDGMNGVQALRTKLAELRSPRILVLGGGATGVEVAAEVACKPGAKVTLATAATFGGFANETVIGLLRHALLKKGVRILEDCIASRIERSAATTNLGDIEHDLCVVCAGFSGQDLVRTSGLAQTEGGRLIVDKQLRSISNRNVHAIGDACVPQIANGAPPRMSVLFAMTTGAHAADAIADELAGRNPRDFGFWTYGQAIGLADHAIGFATFPFDRPVPPYYTGRLGYHVRQFFVWLLFQLLRLERRWPGLPFFFGRPLGRGRSSPRNDDA